MAYGDGWDLEDELCLLNEVESVFDYGDLCDLSDCPDPTYASQLKTKVLNHLKNSQAYKSFSKDLKKSIRTLYLQSANPIDGNELDTPECKEFNSRLKCLSDKVDDMGFVLNSPNRLKLENDLL